MSVLRRIVRGASVAWMFLGLVGFVLALSDTLMFATWAKSLAWVFGVKLWWSGAETTEGMVTILAQSLAQIVVYFGGVALYLATRPRRAAQPAAITA